MIVYPAYDMPDTISNAWLGKRAAFLPCWSQNYSVVHGWLWWLT